MRRQEGEGGQGVSDRPPGGTLRREVPARSGASAAARHRPLYWNLQDRLYYCTTEELFNCKCMY